MYIDAEWKHGMSLKLSFTFNFVEKHMASAVVDTHLLYAVEGHYSVNWTYQRPHL